MHARISEHTGNPLPAKTPDGRGAWNAICRWLTGEASDETLVRRAREGDFRAFDLLVDRHLDRLYRLAMRSVGDESVAADAVVETVLTAFRALDAFDGTCTPAAWLQLHALHVVLRRTGATPVRYRVVMPVRRDAAAGAGA